MSNISLSSVDKFFSSCKKTINFIKVESGIKFSRNAHIKVILAQSEQQLMTARRRKYKIPEEKREENTRNYK